VPTRQARVRRALPGIIPSILVIAAEVIVAVLLILYLRGQSSDLCAQLRTARATSNTTLRAPFRQFALDAAAARAASADRDDKGDPAQRQIDLAAADNYRHIADQVRDLPPLRC
jgi:hypothetical protein